MRQEKNSRYIQKHISKIKAVLNVIERLFVYLFLCIDLILSIFKCNPYKDD